MIYYSGVKYCNTETGEDTDPNEEKPPKNGG